MSTKQTKKKNAAKAAPRAARATSAPAKEKPAKAPKPPKAKPEKPPKAKPAPKPDKAPGKGRHVKILGFSACAVAKALGKAGVKHAEADAIMRAHGIGMPKASLSVQLGFGRNPKAWERHGEPAPLDDGQIKELRAGVQP